MSKFIAIHSLVCLSITGNLLAQPSQVSEQKLREFDFPNAAVSAWKYAAAELSRRGYAKTTTTGRGIESGDFTDTVVYKLSGAKFVFHSFGTNKKGKYAQVLALNDQYSFELREPENQSAGPWVAKNITYTNRSNPTRNQVFVDILRKVHTHQTFTLVGNSGCLLDVVQHPGFIVTGIRSTTYRERDCVEVEFLWQPKELEPDMPTFAERGKLTFDVHYGWLLVKWREETPARGYRTGENREIRRVGKVFVPWRKSIRTYGSDDSVIYESENAIEEFELRRIPDSEFSLTAFGLPEYPPKDPGHSFPWGFWLAIVVGVGGIAFGVYLRSRSSRN